jgi:hypothetical protein
VPSHGIPVDDSLLDPALVVVVVIVVLADVSPPLELLSSALALSLLAVVLDALVDAVVLDAVVDDALVPALLAVPVSAKQPTPGQSGSSSPVQPSASTSASAVVRMRPG